MPKPANRAHSAYAIEAATHFGLLIRKARLDRKETAAQLAERAGISRGLLQRIERGDPGCSIGAAFEVAALLGIRLFDLAPASLSASNKALGDMLVLMPSRARISRKAVKDDF